MAYRRNNNHFIIDRTHLSADQIAFVQRIEHARQVALNQTCTISINSLPFDSGHQIHSPVGSTNSRYSSSTTTIEKHCS